MRAQCSFSWSLSFISLRNGMKETNEFVGIRGLIRNRNIKVPKITVLVCVTGIWWYWNRDNCEIVDDCIGTSVISLKHNTLHNVWGGKFKSKTHGIMLYLELNRKLAVLEMIICRGMLHLVFNYGVGERGECLCETIECLWMKGHLELRTVRTWQMWIVHTPVDGFSQPQFTNATLYPEVFRITILHVPFCQRVFRIISISFPNVFSELQFRVWYPYPQI